MTSRRSHADHMCLRKHEVVSPAVPPRVKQNLHASSHRVDSTQIRPLTKVAPVTRKREIVDSVSPAVLPRNHMLNVMGKFAVSLVKPAILASLASPLTDEPPGCGVHIIGESDPDAAGL